MRRGGSAVDELLQAILRTERDEIVPVVDASRPEGYYYPFLEGQGLPPTDVELLEALTERGDLIRYVKYKLLTCPDDGHLQLRPTHLCPSCGSENIGKEPLIEHFPCGHIAAASDFQQRQGLVCPKCGKRLKLLGKDYRRPADFYRCRQCGEITYVPEVSLHCPVCGHYFDLSDVDDMVLYAYRREEGRPAQLRDLLAEAAAILERAGYEVSLMTQLEGRSGVHHACDLYAARRVSGLQTELLLDVALAARSVSSKALISLYGKAEDLGVGALLFVAIPALDESARGYAMYHDIRVLETPRDGAADRLQEFLREELLLGRVSRKR